MKKLRNALPRLTLLVLALVLAMGIVSTTTQAREITAPTPFSLEVTAFKCKESSCTTNHGCLVTVQEQTKPGVIDYVINYPQDACAWVNVRREFTIPDYDCTQGLNTEFTYEGEYVYLTVTFRATREPQEHTYTTATCVKEATCIYCGATKDKDPNTHEQPDVIYTVNADDTTQHDVKYACCDTVIKTAPHTFQYSASGNTLTETCADNCGHTETAMLNVAGTQTYTGNALTPATITYTDNWQGEKKTNSDITYNNNTNVSATSHAVAELTLSAKTITTSFTIVPADLSGAVITLSETSFTYDGQEHKPTVSVTLDNFESLRNNTDYTVSYSNNVAYGEATVTVTGKGNFKGTATNTFFIQMASPIYTAPTGCDVLYTGSSHDLVNGGSVNFGPALQYSLGTETAPGSEWSTDIPTATDAGTYYVWYKIDGGNNFESVNPACVTASINYLDAPTQPYGIDGAILYNGTYYANAMSTVTLTPPEGYAISTALNGTYGNSVDFTIDSILEKVYLKRANDGAMTDSIPVQIVFDGTAPTGNIRIDEQHSWDKLISPVTFDLFLKDKPSLAITATDDVNGVDNVSGVASIEYFVSDEKLDATQIPADDWKPYTAPVSLEADGKYVLYAKLTDNVGNIRYLSSNGIVVDNQPPAFYGIEDGGVYYGYKIIKVLDNNNLLTFYMDDVDVTDQIGGDDEFKLIGDNKSHTLRVVDAAGNVTEWTVTVMKNYTVTFTADGEKVTEVTVGHGQAAVLPAVPAKDGYSAAWDKSGKDITADTTITAVYTIKKYTVTYVADGKTVETLTVEHGKDAAAPTVPAKDGYTAAWDGDGKNITADTIITARYTAIDPGEFENATPTTNAGGGKLTDTVAELEKAIPLTDAEKTARINGADILVWLETDDISKTVSADDKILIEKELDGGKVGMYLDVSLFKQIGSEDAVKLTELNGTVNITITVPDSLINTNQNVTRTYLLIRIHDGAAKVITPTFDATAKTLTFETDSFSTYALAYKDVEKPDPTNPGTGDDFPLMLWSILLVSSFCSIAYLSCKHRRSAN